MATNYEGLIDVGGEIRTTEGKAFKDPTELAGHLGIDAQNIDWGQIQKQNVDALSEKPSVVSPDALDNSQFNLPPVTPSNVGASTIDKAGGLNAQGDYFRQQADLANKQYEDAQKRQDEMLNQLNESQTSAQDFLAQQQDQFKIQEQFNQITNLITEATDIQGNLNNIIEQRDLALIGADGMPISLEHIRGEKELISRKFDARIASESARLSSKQATIQAVQGNISQARSFVNDAVDAMTFDQQQRVDLLGTFIDLNRDTINSLDAKYQNSIQGAMDTANTQLDIAREDAQAKMDLVTQAAQYGVALNVDNMTLEQANQAFAETVAPIANTGTGGAGIEPDEELSDIDYDFREAARLVIAEEAISPEASGEQYGKLIEALTAEYPNLTSGAIDRRLIQAIQDIKGTQPETPQQVDDNIGSDFITDAEALSGKTQAVKSREVARQNAINRGLKIFLDPTTGEFVNI